MKTIVSNSLAHRKLITKHETLVYMSDLGRITIRKDHGEFIVRSEDFEYGERTPMKFKTLRGAQIASEGLIGLL